MLEKLYRDHSRKFEEFTLVYPVLSRRSNGLSLGINLSPSQACSFNCIYCQVKKDPALIGAKFNMAIFEQELRQLIRWFLDETLFKGTKFSNLENEQRNLRDLALSGDGEPSLFPQLHKLLLVIENIKQEFPLLKKIPLIMITNGSGLHRPSFQRAYPLYKKMGGTFWIKLDCGDPVSFNKTNRTRISFEQILENITAIGRQQSIDIQTCLMKTHGKYPTSEMVNDYINTVGELVRKGVAIRRVQIYSIARDPRESFAEPLSKSELDNYATMIREMAQVRVDTF